jgi:hypothetical protein
MFSLWSEWNIAHLALNNHHSFVPVRHTGILYIVTFELSNWCFKVLFHYTVYIYTFIWIIRTCPSQYPFVKFQTVLWFLSAGNLLPHSIQKIPIVSMKLVDFQRNSSISGRVVYYLIKFHGNIFLYL